MAENSGFFDAEELLDGKFDREYVAEQFANYFKLFISNGVFASPTNQLKVLAGTGMKVILKEGWAFINGYWYHNDADLELTVPANLTAQTVTSGVFIQFNSADRAISAVISAGRTEVDRESPHYELKVAEIEVATGTTAITDAMITDTRTNESVCGFVTGLLSGVIPTEDLFVQYTSIFNEWFDRMKGQLSEDAAGHLQLEIEALQGNVGLDYNSYEEAMADIANIPDGARVFTLEPDETIRDIIDGMTSIHLAGSQVGTGTKNFTFNTEAQKRMLIITKKSGVIVESKEIPTDVLSSGDVIPLGGTAPVITTSTTNAATGNSLKWQTTSGTPIGVNAPDGVGLGVNNSGTLNMNRTTMGSAYYEPANLASDLSQTTGASLTYNGNDSFTISVTDASLSVYVYVDMLVLGGSASGRNVSFNASGTDLVSTDVEGAIKELNEDLTELSTKAERGDFAMPNLDYANPLHTFGNGQNTYTATKDCYLVGLFYPNTAATSSLSINNTVISSGWMASGYTNVSPQIFLKLSAGDTVNAGGNSTQLHVFGVKA